MDKYLLEILKSVNTIIIPGLGALTITNHDTGEIMFMSYLKHDDGKLVSYIVDNEGMEELDAKNLIAKYVREIQLTVDKGESYDMFQFGSFYKNGEEIDFKNWEGDKTETVNEIIDKKETIAPIIEEETVITEEIVEPTIAESQDSVETIFSKEETVIKEEITKEEVAPAILQVKEEEPEKQLNILEKEERAATAAKLEVLRKNQESKKVKNKKGVGFWMLMVLIVLIATGGTYFGLHYDELKQHIPFLADKTPVEEPIAKSDNVPEIKTEEEVPVDIENDIIEEEIPEQTEEIVEPEVIEKPTNFSNSNSDLPFHIIVGAFGSEENANRLGEKLKSEGYNVKVGPGKGMTLVSIKSFATRSEAQGGMNELKSVAPNGWIYEWR